MSKPKKRPAPKPEPTPSPIPARVGFREVPKEEIEAGRRKAYNYAF